MSTGQASDVWIDKVIVKDVTPGSTPATGVTMSPSTLSLTAGQPAQITANVLPVNALKDVTWVSNNTGFIATTGLSVSPSRLTLLSGETGQLNRTIYPANATSSSLTWSSSDTNIATVGNDGLVTAISSGTALITAASMDGRFTSQASVVVNPGVTSYSTRLTGMQDHEYALAKSLSVMPGDIIEIEVFAKYLDNDANNWTEALTNLMTQIAQGTAPTGTLVDGGLAGSIGGAQLPVTPIDHNNDTGAEPKAYLNYIVFDKNMSTVPLDFGFRRITTAAREFGQDGQHERLAFDGVDQIKIKEPGYVYIYLSNENELPIEVYFDDFKVNHIKGPIVSSQDYYPFGLTFKNSVGNKYLFNRGSELQADLNLGWYSTLFRIYDPGIGRFLQGDPLADFFSGITPYNFAENNPVLYGDPSGLSPNIWQRVKAFFGIGRLSGTRAAGNQEYVKPVPRNRAEPKPYLFTLRDHPSTPKPQPASVKPTLHIVEEEYKPEPAVVYIPPGPILSPRPKPKPRPALEPKPQPAAESDPEPDPLPFDVQRGGELKWNAYQFEIRKSDLHHTPQNDKLIKDLITTLKSSSNFHLEIRGNVDADPPVWGNPFDNWKEDLGPNRANAIYKALRDAGIPASQLDIRPGVIAPSGNNVNTTFILTKQ